MYQIIIISIYEYFNDCLSLIMPEREIKYYQNIKLHFVLIISPEM